MQIPNDTLYFISALFISLNILWMYCFFERSSIEETPSFPIQKTQIHTLISMEKKKTKVRKRSDFLSINKHWPLDTLSVGKCQPSVLKSNSDQTHSGREIASQEMHLKWGNISIEDLPFLPGCEPDGPAAKEMHMLFPDSIIPDIVRFLVARKGDVSKAAEMMSKTNAWRTKNLPLSREIAAPAIAAGCFFTHGTANDGTPILYMRGAFYDNRVATAETYVLLAAHIIDYVCRHSTKINVTVLVHAVAVPGAPNLNVDTNFIKLFIQALSDNYPERLKRLVIYPFPWYGRAIWSFLKGFVDIRTQEKVVLLSCDGNTVPPELSEYIDPHQIPECCGGMSTARIQDLMTTFDDATKS